MTVKRYKIGFRVEGDEKLDLLWDGGVLVNLNSVLEAVSDKDPYHYEKFKESFREVCDRHDSEPTTYDWLNGWGQLWRDAIDAERAALNRGAK